MSEIGRESRSNGILNFFKDLFLRLVAILTIATQSVGQPWGILNSVYVRNGGFDVSFIRRSAEFAPTEFPGSATLSPLKAYRLGREIVPHLTPRMGVDVGRISEAAG